MNIEQISITGEVFNWTGELGMCYMCNKTCPPEWYCHRECVVSKGNRVKTYLKAQDKEIMK